MSAFFTFDRRKKVSIQQQIVDQVINYVQDFKLIHGALFPIEELTSKHIKLDKQDITTILKELIKLNYVRLDNEKGEYYIQRPIYDHGFINQVAPISKEIIRSGQKPKFFTLQRTTLHATPALAHKSGYKVGEKLLHLKRYICANDRPIFYISFYLSLEKMLKADQIFKDDQPHLEMMMNQFPLQYQFHIREMKINYAPDFIVELLAPKEKGMICNVGQYRFYNQLGQTSEYGETYLTDLTEFTTISSDLNTLYI
jgi:DNA-binding GntR family transcriptional regulator